MVRPALSIVVPFYNELDTVDQTVAALVDSGAECVFVDDGSRDGTGERLAAAAAGRPNVRVLTHEHNRGANAALLTGLTAAQGDTIVVLDADLSYTPAHIAPLVEAVEKQYAAIALASPYGPGGSVDNVPAFRLAISVAANRIFRVVTRSPFSTYTGMVRAYRRSFLQRVDPRTLRGEINCALLLAALARGERIIEVPARLAWPDSRRLGATRLSARSLARRAGAVVGALRHAPRPKVPFPPSLMLTMTRVPTGYESPNSRQKDCNG